MTAEMIARKADPPPPPPVSRASGSWARILVVDDEPTVCEAIRLSLEPQGHEITTTGGIEHAKVAVARQVFDLALVDLRLGGASGLDLLPILLNADPSLVVVVITANATIPTAVEAMRLGAFEYITKPLAPLELDLVLERALERRRLRRRLSALEDDVHSTRPSPFLDTTSPTMKRDLALALEVAQTDATVLLTGESGTGKGVVARAIHDWSARAKGPFATVNCPALSSELLRSELFGHVKGSFTGATDTREGKIEHAHGGTLFLDEIGELNPALQPQLLRFLQDREYERVGDPVPRTADVRLVAATNADLAQAVVDGEFREDLYYRLNVIQIELLPLRERPGDILPLAEMFLGFFSRRYGKALQGFSSEARALLEAHRWPGNVRELQNAIERAVILERRPEVSAAVLPRGGSSSLLNQLGAADPEALPTFEAMEERYIRHVLSVVDSMERAAEVLGVAPSTLWRRRRKYGI